MLDFPGSANISVISESISLTNTEGQALRGASGKECRAFIIALPFLLPAILNMVQEKPLSALVAVAHAALVVYELAMDLVPATNAPEDMQLRVQAFEDRVRDAYKDTLHGLRARLAEADIDGAGPRKKHAISTAEWLLQLPKAHDMRHLPDAIREIGVLHYASMQATERSHKGVKAVEHSGSVSAAVRTASACWMPRWLSSRKSASCHPAQDAYVVQVARGMIARRGADEWLATMGWGQAAGHRTGLEGAWGAVSREVVGGEQIVRAKDNRIEGVADILLSHLGPDWCGNCHVYGIVRWDSVDHLQAGRCVQVVINSNQVENADARLDGTARVMCAVRCTHASSPGSAVDMVLVRLFEKECAAAVMPNVAVLRETSCTSLLSLTAAKEIVTLFPAPHGRFYRSVHVDNINARYRRVASKSL